MKNLSDAELEAAVMSYVQRERTLVKELLLHLLELEDRSLHLLRGYSSLFDYCRKKLLYSEAEAMLRISSMRLLRQAPEVAEKIQDGTLSLSVAAKVQQTARRENLPEAETRKLLDELSGASKREAEQVIAARFPEAPKPEKARPVSAAEVEIRFTVSKEDFELFQELLNEKAHSNFNRSYAKLFTSLARQEKQKAQQKQPRPERVKREPRQSQGRTRPVQAKVRRDVSTRDDRACQYLDPLTGKKCGARHGVQLDHIIRFADGGAHTPENLRVYCGAHNRLRERMKI